MKTKIKTCFNGIKKPILITLILFLICGLIYPLLMTGISQLLFPHQANGSLVEFDGKVVGSELIGQDFTEDYYMKCRPSAIDYNTYTQEQIDSGEYTGVSSGSDNLAPTNPELVERVKADIEKFLKNNPNVAKEDIPTDLMTASGSGLDPHISPESAQVQLDALVIATGLSIETLKEIVENNTVGKGFGIFGESTVNVLGVNLEITKLMGKI